MRVVVTGLGVLSSIGSDQGTFKQNLYDGVRKFEPISLFDTSKYRCCLGGQVSTELIESIVPKKSLGKYDRIQLLALAATEMAWKDACLDPATYKSDDMGVVIGATYGYIDSLTAFYLESLKDGPAYVSPIAFANTVMNAPAGKISIKHKITGFCTTIATGETSGLDAIAYAYDFLKMKKCKAVLVGAGNILCEALYMGFYHTGKLAGGNRGANIGTEFYAPFDARANGMILGEGAGILVLESLDSAKDRGAAPLAEIKGTGSHFRPYQNTTNEQAADSVAYAMKSAVEESDLKADDISLISASANAAKATDKVEAMAIGRAFGPKSSDIPVTAIKSMVGECLDASSMLQSIAAIFSVQDNKIPPIVNLKYPLGVSNLNYVLDCIDTIKIDNVLVNSLSCNGKKTSLVISKYQD
jgi:3-oxoacyl-[acyl-carrier-protein] synthase II